MKLKIEISSRNLPRLVDHVGSDDNMVETTQNVGQGPQMQPVVTIDSVRGGKRRAGLDMTLTVRLNVLTQYHRWTGFDGEPELETVPERFLTSALWAAGIYQ